MNSVVISYSWTGNNRALADSVAKELALEHIRVTEAKTRTMGSIFQDLIFNKTPGVGPVPESLENYRLLLLFGPVWAGRAATPLRTYFKRIKNSPCNYAYISISGGADNSNPKLADDLKKRTGKEPAALIDLHIADLLPPGAKPTRKDTSAYKLNNSDIEKLTVQIKKAIKELAPTES